jgi:signal transduction histidine kinase
VEHYNRSTVELLGSSNLGTLESLYALFPGFARSILEMEPGQAKIISITRAKERLQLLLRMTQLKYDDRPLKLLSLQDVRTELDEQELIAWRRLIRVLNHEIMNSLTPIRTLTHAIERSLLELGSAESGEAIIQDIRDNSRLISQRTASMTDFVNRYRDITRIREISKQPVALGPLLQEVKTLFEKQFLEQGVNCTLQVEPADLEIEGDENMLKQVLINLVKNSLEALKDDDGELIQIFANKIEKHHVIVVEDNGPGIPEEFLEDIFTPFFSTREDGSGIGLSFSKQIVRLHGGSINIQSEKGKGTKVSIKFSEKK